MSYADKIYVERCKKIIENGISNEGEKVRPHWEDGTPAYTKRLVPDNPEDLVAIYDLRTERFEAALTLRKTALKSAMDEILWIWQKKSNNINDLNSHIWDQWADENGFIGKAYGYQQAKLHPYTDVSVAGITEAFPGIKKGYSYINGVKSDAYGYNYDLVMNPIAIKSGSFWWMTQIDKAIYDLVNTPYSRRIIVDMWNPEESYAMHLTPCAYSVTFTVTNENGQKVLNMLLNQRSQDMLAAGNWNVCQYAILLMMIARHCKMIPGRLMHVIADCHIYDRHIPIVKNLIEREQYPAPIVTLNPEKQNFYRFTTDDLIVKDYITGEQIKNIPIAI